MPIYTGTCPEHGSFERLLPQAGHPPARVHCPEPECKKYVKRDATAPAIRFAGDGFQTPRPAPKAADTGTAILKQERY